jgi:hypothetical protein
MSAKDERAGREPRVECTSCRFAWYSVQMAEGLKLLGECPRCHGKLRFTERASTPAGGAEPDRFAAPHLALGLPRPPQR